MSVYIRKIELKNWFNYKGDFETNEITFSKGLNVLVGDNNAGKTKLHNAIRWMLSDNVILEIEDDTGEYEINADNAKMILNQSVFRETSNMEKVEFGVRLTFIESKRGEEKEFILTKKAVGRKNLEELTEFSEVKNVQIVNKRTKQPRTASDDFEDVVNKIIQPRFRDYFFIEGEQLGLMTPLQGDRLKRTINSIVQIKTLDHLVTKSQDLKKHVKNKVTEVQGKEENLSKNKSNLIEEKKELEEESENLEQSLSDVQKESEKNQILIEKYKKKAELSKQNKELKNEYDKLDGNVELCETVENQSKLNYIAQYVNKSSFAASRLHEEVKIEEEVSNYLEEIRSFISLRRTELDTKIDERQELMLMKLEKSQPKPEILQEMLDKNHCFVCDSELNRSSSDYIEKVLIPFFQDALEDDDEINNLNSLSEILNSLLRDSREYLQKDTELLGEFETMLADSTSGKLYAQDKLNEFISSHGKIEEKEEDGINLDTYGKAIVKKRDAEKVIIVLRQEIDKSERRIKQIDDEFGSDITEESKELKNALNLSQFSQDLNNFLVNFKSEQYKEFAAELEKKATIRYQSFMRNNPIAQNQEIKVEIEESYRNEYEFEIFVTNEFGEKQNQPGGADQALRRVAVVFGLLDIAENKNGYPFIADAPISKLSPDTKRAFFESLSTDEVLNQSIILNMDLWSASKKDLNEIGKDVLAKLKKIDNSKLLALKPLKGNKGVEIQEYHS